MIFLPVVLSSSLLSLSLLSSSDSSLEPELEDEEELSSDEDDSSSDDELYMFASSSDFFVAVEESLRVPGLFFSAHTGSGVVDPIVLLLRILLNEPNLGIFSSVFAVPSSLLSKGKDDALGLRCCSIVFAFSTLIVVLAFGGSG